jgi:S-formylglutathione hydrolase FrmB
MALIESRFDSQVLDLSLGMNVILPELPKAWDTPPAVLYLLHGLSDDHTIWSRRTSIERYAADYPLVVVMPDVHKSFYCDMKHGSKYWTFISEELPMLINRWLKVSSAPEDTFVAGLSMGGYGAMKWALRYPSHFSAAASIAGALDIAAHINDEWDDSRVAAFKAVFDRLEHIPDSTNDLIAELGKVKHPPSTRFYVCCGTEDYLYPDSIAFRDKATEAGLNLTYKEGPGEHDWKFCDTWIQHVLEWLPVGKLECD